MNTDTETDAKQALCGLLKCYPTAKLSTFSNIIFISQCYASPNFSIIFTTVPFISLPKVSAFFPFKNQLKSVCLTSEIWTECAICLKLFRLFLIVLQSVNQCGNCVANDHKTIEIIIYIIYYYYSLCTLEWEKIIIIWRFDESFHIPIEFLIYIINFSEFWNRKLVLHMNGINDIFYWIFSWILWEIIIIIFAQMVVEPIFRKMNK